jgi:hypothetical protein
MLLPLIVGLVSGIGFIILISILVTIPPKTTNNQDWPIGPVGRQAIEIAMNDSTVQELFGDRSVKISYVRDQGVSHSKLDCPRDRCALVIFADNDGNNNTGSETSLASVLVNVDSKEVFIISLSDDQAIERANLTNEVQYFVSKYPAAQTNVYALHGRIVEHYFLDDVSSKWADLRITLGSDNEIELMQIRCAVIHKETSTILNPETDLVEQHGKRLPDVAEFLQNELCPE